MTSFPIDPGQAIQAASNIVMGTNPPYTTADFLSFYPQFGGLLDPGIIDKFVTLANATVIEARWHENWEQGMADFIGHHCILYLIKVGGTTASQVIAASQPRGLQSSKSVGDVSVSYDFNFMNDDFKGWGNYQTTSYGRDFITIAKRLAKAGMYVW